MLDLLKQAALIALSIVTGLLCSLILILILAGIIHLKEHITTSPQTNEINQTEPILDPRFQNL